ncbi:hypothetical protein J4E89_006331 [Alternaria sp. Ai002NY15]|nr:hypothetical protein J4E89_006331 [Alternaria sp. Ai002NY15]
MNKMFLRQILIRVVIAAALLKIFSIFRRQHAFQAYIERRKITFDDFPESYARALNDSVARNEQPLESDYTSTYTGSKIPRTIHYIWFERIYPNHEGSSGGPSIGFGSPKLCREHNPSYEIRMWNATSAREFLSNEYAWFLPTYDGYRYPIQKVDALKYFALYHFGGVYMDLDVACRRSLDPLLDFPAWFPEASPLGVNNDLMASAAKHPVVKKMTEGLATHNWNLLFPYLTIFWTTGPQFTSTILQEWFEACPDGQCKQWKARYDLDPTSFLVLPRIFYSEEYTFFGHKPGGSWHGSDVAVVLWFVDRPWAIASVAAAFIGIVGGIARVRRTRARQRVKVHSQFV